MTYKGMKYGF